MNPSCKRCFALAVKLIAASLLYLPPGFLLLPIDDALAHSGCSESAATPCGHEGEYLSLSLLGKRGCLSLPACSSSQKIWTNSFLRVFKPSFKNPSRSLALKTGAVSGSERRETGGSLQGAGKRGTEGAIREATDKRAAKVAGDAAQRSLSKSERIQTAKKITMGDKAPCR